MIKECNEMYVNGNQLEGLNKDFLKGKVVFNGSSKISGSNLGVVKGFYRAGEDNKTHSGLRFLAVETIDGSESKNWWIDLKEGLNPDLYVMKDEDVKILKSHKCYNVVYEDLENSVINVFNFSNEEKAREYLGVIANKMIDKYCEDNVEVGFNIVEVVGELKSAYIVENDINDAYELDI